MVPSERKQGLGELLMIAAQIESIFRGRKLSHLLVCDRNEAAVKLYKKLGFNMHFQSNDKIHNLLMGKQCVACKTMHWIHVSLTLCCAAVLIQ